LSARPIYQLSYTINSAGRVPGYPWARWLYRIVPFQAVACTSVSAAAELMALYLATEQRKCTDAAKLAHYRSSAGA